MYLENTIGVCQARILLCGWICEGLVPRLIRTPQAIWHCESNAVFWHSNLYHSYVGADSTWHILYQESQPTVKEWKHCTLVEYVLVYTSVHHECVEHTAGDAADRWGMNLRLHRKPHRVTETTRGGQNRRELLIQTLVLLLQLSAKLLNSCREVTVENIWASFHNRQVTDHLSRNIAFIGSLENFSILQWHKTSKSANTSFSGGIVRRCLDALRIAEMCRQELCLISRLRYFQTPHARRSCDWFIFTEHA